MDSNRSRYLQSLGAEVSAQAHRVRDLIGDRHWPSDGSHHEAVLAGVLGRHLPTGVILRRGFVVAPQRSDICSGEQDLLLIETLREAPCFDQNGLAICFPRNLLASVEVKSTLSKTAVTNAVKHLLELGDVLAGAGVQVAPWLGVFVHDMPKDAKDAGEKIRDWVCELLEKVSLPRIGLESENRFLLPSAIAVGDTHFCRVDFAPDRGIRVTAYNGPGHATAAFFACLLEHLAASRKGETGFQGFFESGAIIPLDGEPRYVTPLSS